MRTTALLLVPLAVCALGRDIAAQGAPPPAPTAPASVARPGRSVIVERVIVRVNGEIFTQSQLTQRQIDALRERNQQVRDSQALEDDAAMRGLLSEVTPGILVNAVDELLLVQRARELGSTFSDENFKNAIDRIKEQNKLDDAGLKRALDQEGLTMEQLRTNFERTALIQQVQNEEIFRKMNLTDEEVRQYYASHRSEFMTPLSVTLREIFIPVPTQTRDGQEVFVQADDIAAKVKADAAHARVVAGENFEAVVQTASESPTKANGGKIGPINVTDLNPTLAQEIEKLQPGQASAPVRAARGYQILKLETRSEPELLPMDRVRPQIEQRIREARLGEETQKLLRRLRAQAVIEWKDDALKKTYEDAVAAAGQHS